MIEPNSLPEIFDDWDDWRNAHAGFCAEFISGQTGRDVFRRRLELLGLAASSVEAEIVRCVRIRGWG